jgi:hypothetical protein
MRVISWLDKHLWILPVTFFAVPEIILVILRYSSHRRVFLNAISAADRQNIYSSLTGSSSGLLGFALAAVAILAAFGRKATQSQADRTRENALADARLGISKVLLATSFFLMVVLICATVGMGVDNSKVGNFVLASVIFSSSLSSLIGILVSGAGLTLSLVERSRE